MYSSFVLFCGPHGYRYGIVHLVREAHEEWLTEPRRFRRPRVDVEVVVAASDRRERVRVTLVAQGNAGMPNALEVGEPRLPRHDRDRARAPRSR